MTAKSRAAKGIGPGKEEDGYLTRKVSGPRIEDTEFAGSADHGDEDGILNP
jgi:hypothetical protein